MKRGRLNLLDSLSFTCADGKRPVAFFIADMLSIYEIRMKNEFLLKR